MISGIRRGHKLKSPKGQSTRPTEDRIKESLFNILGPLKKDSVALDLFSGSGSIGIEFLSRGAERVYFIDSAYDSINTIKENLSHTRLSEYAMVYKKDSIEAIKFLKGMDLKFDYIYIDPPFENHELLFNTLSILNNYSILKEDGIIIIEHEKKMYLDKDIEGFKMVDYRDYGSKSITFFKVSKEEIHESNISG